MQMGFVSVFWTNLLDPVASMVEILIPLKLKDPNSDIPTGPENGYSISIIALTVVMVESVIGRIQYLDFGDTEPQKAVEFIRAKYPEFADRIEESFVVRDVIVHNHLWKAWSDNHHTKIVSADLREGYGDKKYWNVIDRETRTTKKLRINVFPTSLCRTDAQIVLRTAVEFLLFLEGKDRNYVYLSPQFVKFLGDMIEFTKLVELPWGDS